MQIQALTSRRVLRKPEQRWRAAWLPKQNVRAPFPSSQSSCDSRVFSVLLKAMRPYPQPMLLYQPLSQLNRLLQALFGQSNLSGLSPGDSLVQHNLVGTLLSERCTLHIFP
eukprot:Lithocolla_globosa_v1_NODE_8005_length_874_cov_5.258852.p2 type:complete len:111 gc:universal NODE_8005_length_874_cov_5.258852:484-152(-)